MKKLKVKVKLGYDKTLNKLSKDIFDGFDFINSLNKKQTKQFEKIMMTITRNHQYDLEQVRKEMKKENKNEKKKA